MKTARLSVLPIKDLNPAEYREWWTPEVWEQGFMLMVQMG